MFTGIVEGVGKVTSVQAGKITVAGGDVLRGMEPSGSIAVNGVCLTITSLNNNSFSVDLMPETLKRTNLGRLKAGDKVNLERPMALGERLSGHLVQGHVDAMGRVTSIRPDAEAIVIKIEAPPEIMRYVVEKGSITVNGISLTVVTRDSNSFEISIIDYTRQHTTMGEQKVGDVVNLEVDIIAKYVEQLLQAHSPGITTDLLRERGF